MAATAKPWERLEKMGLQPAGTSQAEAPTSHSTSHGEGGAGSSTWALGAKAALQEVVC